jgi:hypothetical protein
VGLGVTLELRLLPYLSLGDCGYAHTVLAVAPRQRLFARMRREAARRHLRWDFTSYFSPAFGELRRYGEMAADAHGEPLTWLPAGWLAAVLQAYREAGDGGNDAVLAYLRALPPAAKVVLYWC